MTFEEMRMQMDLFGSIKKAIGRLRGDDLGLAGIVITRQEL
jgi:hypothetical protein